MGPRVRGGLKIHHFKDQSLSPGYFDRLTSRLVGTPKAGKNEGVHNVHTLGSGSVRMSAGLGRIAEVFGGVADFQGLEPGSSLTSGTCFPCSGACGPLRVHNLFTDAGQLLWPGVSFFP